MKFTTLKLVGFKSFVDSTEMRIDPGLTGVIGPNGCGKSNLLEALRWVMGATSAKSLRGSGMEDVIFSGTDARPSRERAEVLLSIDNAERDAPARFNDHASLDVIRKITRGAGSDYTVNGESVRAKDVQLLFADAGTGANSPALVRQGQINELIAAKPENRRRVLEEAAGVSGLRARRHESELRLRGAETNLDRLQDVVDDLEIRFEALKKQSRQAARYRGLSESIRDLEAALWLQRWKDAKAALDTASAALAESQAGADEAVRTAALASTAAEEAGEQQAPSREAEAEASAALRRLERERDALVRDAEDARRSVENLRNRLTELAGTAERELVIRDDAEARRVTIQTTIEELEAAGGEEAARLNELANLRRDTEAERAQKDAAFDQATRDAAEAHAAKDAATRDVTQAEARLETLNRALTTAQDTRSAMGEAALDLAFDPSQVDALQEKAEAARAALADAEAARIDAEAQERACNEQRREVEGERSALEREIAALERMLAQESVENRALDAIRAAPGYEKALAAALGEDLDASLDAGAARAWSKSSVRADTLPAGCEPLVDHVDAPPALAARLSAIGVVDADGASAAISGLRPGQRLVSRAGDLWRWDGYTARADAPSPAAARLEQTNRLDAARNELEALAPAITTAQGKAESARAALAKARETEANTRAAIPPAEAAARDAVNSLAAARETAAREAERRLALDADIERLSGEQTDVRTALQAATCLIESLQTDTGVEDRLHAARAAADMARRAADEARGADESARRDAETRLNRLTSLAEESADWIKRAESAAERLETLAGETTRTEARLQEALSKPDLVDAKLETLAESLGEAERKAANARETALDIENRAKQADAAARTAEREASTAREARAADEARQTAARERIDETLARLVDACGAEPGALESRVDEKYLRFSHEELEQRLDSARASRERLGAVNLRADEEATELETRRDELVKERDDLIAAIDRLRKGVDALSREGRARLLEAFERVDAHFRKLFETLFEGGRAELRLTESDDPLEAGLEIFACPPGKKLENMSLLSGGEQALTACALIFAVFLSNPAPVCVLDEVDAPLDDANVDRFCRMLDEMRRMTETRFLVITHNPLTMSRMDRLYGVTMGERGVSQLVSVDLDGAERLIAAE